MVGLCRDSTGWRLRQRSILFERAVILLDFPAFLIDCREGQLVQGQITGDQIENACAAIFVCEDLFRE